MKKKLIVVLLCMAFLLSAGIRQTDKGVEFTYSNEKAKSVSVVGSFNDWNVNADKMKQDKTGIWRIEVSLKEGSYSYKYFVDGNWVLDEENPEKDDDGYGGHNSVARVLADRKKTKQLIKEVKLEKGENKISSSLNPKVYFDGRYYTKNIMKKDDLSRYMLDKPYHDINLGIEVKLNNNMSGYTVLNINNTRESVDMWKTHLNYKRTLLKLDADYFDVQAFDNTGVAVFDDPLNIIGGEGYYNYNFGYDYRGVYLESGSEKITGMDKLPLKIKLNALAADEVGDAERDVTAARMKIERDFGDEMVNYNLLIGASIYDSRVNDNYSYSLNDSTSYSGGVVNSNPAWEIDTKLVTTMDNHEWQDKMELQLEFEHYEYDNKLIFKEHGENEIVSEEEFVWQEGRNEFLSFAVKFPKTLRLGMSYRQNLIKSNYQVYYDNEFTVPSDKIVNSELSKDTWEFFTEIDEEYFDINLRYKIWSNKFPDSLSSWNEYYRFMERTSGNGKWYQDYNDLSYCQYFLLGYDKGMIWNLDMSYELEKIKAEYEVNIAQYGFDTKPELIENILRFKYQLNENWDLIADARLPLFNSEFLDLKTDFGDNENVFLSDYYALRYHLNENVWLSLGFGVNPYVVSEITDEFYDGGRREYLEEAGALDEFLQSMYSNFGKKVKDAEKALSEDDMISLEAVIRF